MTSIRNIDRRAILLGALAAAPALAMPGLLRAQDRIATLAFFGPPAGPSVTLAHAVATNRFADIADARAMGAVHVSRR